MNDDEDLDAVASGEVSCAEHARLSVGALFPLLGSSGLPRDLLDDSVGGISSEPSLLSSRLRSRFVTDDGVRLGACFPMLYRALHTELPAHLMSVRAYNALRRRKLVTWGHLIGFSHMDFLAVDNFGITSLGSVFDAAVVESFELAAGAFRVTERTVITEPDTIRAQKAYVPSPAVGKVTNVDSVLGLASLGFEEIPAGTVPSQLRSQLGRLHPSEPLSVCNDDLLNQRNLGDRSIVEFKNRLENLVPISTRGDHDIHSFDDFSAVLDWASQERGVCTVGELLEMRGEVAPLPARIDAVWKRVLAASIESGEPEVGRRVADLLNDYDDRQMLILRHRTWCRGSAHTLDQVGRAAGVTREWVRQLQSRLEGELRHRVQAPRFHSVLDRSQELRLRLGTAVRLDSARFREAADWATRDFQDGTRSDGLALLLWFAGPYQERDGWLVVVDKIAMKVRALELSARARETGSLDNEAVQSYLESIGVAEDQHAAWLASFTSIEKIDGVWIDTSGSVIDAAASYLAVRGEPLTAEEILIGLGRDASVRSVRQRLFDDDRFQRVTKSHFALAVWGMDEYTTVAGEMAEEIERSGGQLPLDVLIERLVRRHDISPTSVRMYSERPVFAMDSLGQISLRDLNTYVVNDDLTGVPGCYELGTRTATWRVRVDSEIRRGSGRRIPEQLAGWLGVRPGEQLEMHHLGGRIPFAWAPWGQPTVGSLKSFVESFGAVDGDWIVLSFRKPQSVEVHYVEQPSGRNVTYGDLARMIGLPQAGERSLRDVATALGVDFESDDDALRFRVRGVAESRGDADLVEMLDAIMFG